MNKFARSLGFILFGLLSTSTYAKTFKYDLAALNSHQGPINYPKLNFNQVKSAVFTVNKDPLTPELQISSLEVTFPNAAKLLATDFKKIEPNLYRAVVNDAWIYRQVIVDVRELDFNRPAAHALIEVYVSEKSAFIQPEITTDAKGENLFHVNGILRDITTAKIADTAVVTVNSKNVTLSLKDLLTYAPVESQINGPREGFVIDALWQGKGQKTIYIPAPASLEEFDRYTAIGLTLTERDLVSGKEYFFSIKYKDEGFNGELNTPEQPLRPLLNSAFNSNP